MALAGGSGCRAAFFLLGALASDLAGLGGVAWAAGEGSGRGVMIVDFESGSAPLESFEDEDFDPNDWATEHNDPTYIAQSRTLQKPIDSSQLL